MYYVLRHYRLFFRPLFLISVGLLMAGLLSIVKRLNNQPVTKSPIAPLTDAVGSFVNNAASVLTFVELGFFAVGIWWLFYAVYRIWAARSGRDKKLCLYCGGITETHRGRRGKYTHCLACGEKQI